MALKRLPMNLISREQNLLALQQMRSPQEQVCDVLLLALLAQQIGLPQSRLTCPIQVFAQ